MTKAAFLLAIILVVINLPASGQSDIHSDTSYVSDGKLVDIRTFKKRKLINHIVRNDTGKLMYQYPLLPAQKVPVYKLKSGRTYYDSKQADTLVFERNVPEMNLWVSFPGAAVMKLDPYTYIIKSWKPQPGTQNGKVVIRLFENVFYKSKLVYEKVVYYNITGLPQ